MVSERYTEVEKPLSLLLEEIKIGQIGLPDLQRPYVWPDAKVRNLLDSLIKGFPVGYLMLWNTPDEYGKDRFIGTDEKNYKKTKQLVIDGQQRLTALYAALYGAEVVDSKYSSRKIKIAFNPFTKKFDVCSAAIEKDVNYVPDISVLLSVKESKILERKKYLEKLRQKRKADNDKRGIISSELISIEEESLIESNFDELYKLLETKLPVIEIMNDLNEKDVAEIFVRVNSAGQHIKENDFIMTLISVYNPELKNKINTFCKESSTPGGTSYNPLISLDMSHIVRIASGLAFNRGRLNYAYKILLGIDLKDKKSEPSPERRAQMFECFSNAVDTAMNTTDWNMYVNTIEDAGFVSKLLISSKYAVVYCYLFYLIGKHTFKVKQSELKYIIRKWFFYSALTSFYTGSSESDVESQLNDLSDLEKKGENFVNYFDTIMQSELTDSYFDITLPHQLEKTGNKNPLWYSFVASQIVLGSKAMFSNVSIQQLLTAVPTDKPVYDRHHIFPKNYLKQLDFNSRKIDQLANFTFIDYDTNIDIGDDPPATYVPPRRKSMGEEEYKSMCDLTALPENFETMDYSTFLEKRRSLMAKIIKRGYESLCGKESPVKDN